MQYDRGCAINIYNYMQSKKKVRINLILLFMNGKKDIQQKLDAKPYL